MAKDDKWIQKAFKKIDASGTKANVRARSMEVKAVLKVLKPTTWLQI